MHRNRIFWTFICKSITNTDLICCCARELTSLASVSSSSVSARVWLASALAWAARASCLAWASLLSSSCFSSSSSTTSLHSGLEYTVIWDSQTRGQTGDRRPWPGRPGPPVWPGPASSPPPASPAPPQQPPYTAAWNNHTIVLHSGLE